MSKVAVVYWSGTGNTEEMANLVAEGARNAGADVSVFPVAEFVVDSVQEYDALAFGCPAMGSEVLEEWEFQPMWDEASNYLSDKNIVLFGSYDWGDGEWMRNWQEDAQDKGAVLLADPVLAHFNPEGEVVQQLTQLGEELAK
ncbi:MAG TPA: flavodoxin [Erysipelothrix sp.]|nr:flavodoxin [Erysipelothrix sp.]